MFTPKLASTPLTVASTPGTLWCTCRIRQRPTLSMVCTWGRLTDIVVLPPNAKSRSLPATKRPMSCCASSVEPPTCGVKITFGMPLQA